MIISAGEVSAENRGQDVRIISQIVLLAEEARTRNRVFRIRQGLGHWRRQGLGLWPRFGLFSTAPTTFTDPA
jgi:hypothetical protein